MSILLERDQLVFSLNNANQRMHELEQKLNDVKIEKRALLVPGNFQSAEIRALKSEKESIYNLLVDQEANSGTERKRRRTGYIYSGLCFQHVGIASKVLKSVSTWCAREQQSFIRLKVWTEGNGHAGMKTFLAVTLFFLTVQ